VIVLPSDATAPPKNATAPPRDAIAPPAVQEATPSCSSRSEREQAADDREAGSRDSGLAPGGLEGRDTLTAVGRFLRRTSLDELPQLINVVRGEMSLVGPSPERSELVELFAREIRGYRDRHQVRAGMTGLAQVRGLRGPTSLRARVGCDRDYVANWSLWLDVRILVRTVFPMVARRAQGDVESVPHPPETSRQSGGQEEGPGFVAGNATSRAPAALNV
jgi:hypothetical protein